MADLAEATLELHRAAMAYLCLEAFKYGKCPVLAQAVLAVGERPIMPTRMGAILCFLYVVKRKQRERL